MTEKIDKSTFNAYKTELFAPIMKDSAGKFLAILSDTSVDRDGERVGKSALIKLKADDGYLAALIDHENKALGQVAKWINRELKEIDGHMALVAEPQFFESNPNAQIIKGMLEEGAEFGISIGAMVKDYKEEKYEGKSMRTYTELELLEASFVAIPSNKHGRCMAVAKSFNLKEDKSKMTEELQKKLDDNINKVAELEKSKAELEKSLELKDSEISKLQKNIEESEKKAEEKEKEAEEAKKEADEAAKSLEAEKKKSLEKAEFVKKDKETSAEDMDKAFSEGKVPISRL